MSKRKKSNIPSLSGWNCYAANHNGKRSYDFYAGDIRAGGRQYSIVPIESDRGRHRGYALACFPGGPRGGRRTGHRAILSNGGEGGDHDLNKPTYRSPQAAVAAARAHAARMGE